MRRPRRHRPEDIVQKAVFQHLRVRPAAKMVAWHTPNGGLRSPVEAAIMSGMGVIAGVPDLIAIKDGTVFALELKADDGKLTPAQSSMLEQIKAAGGNVAVAYGIDQAIRQIEAWQLVKGKSS